MSHHSICHACQATCCKMGGTDFTEEEKQAVLDAGHEDFFVALGENHYELKTEDGICPYLSKENACKIYDVRPLYCKTFPIYMYQGEIVLVNCPLTKTLSEDDLQELKESYKKMPEGFFEVAINGSKLSADTMKKVNAVKDSLIAQGKRML